MLFSNIEMGKLSDIAEVAVNKFSLPINEAFSQFSIISRLSSVFVGSMSV